MVTRSGEKVDCWLISCHTFNEMDTTLLIFGIYYPSQNMSFD